MQLNDAVRKLLYPEQAERHLAMPRCKKGNAFPNEGRHDGDDELVDRLLVQKGPDDLASAHHPDVLAGLQAEASAKAPIDSVTKWTPAGTEAGGRNRENT